MTCPPCNNHCNHGIDCSNYDTRHISFVINLNGEFESEYIKYRNAFPKEKYVLPVDRNEVLEEVAKEFDKMPFGDTSASFASYVRGMKR